MIPQTQALNHSQCLQILELLKHEAASKSSSFHPLKPSSSKSPVQPLPSPLPRPSALSPVHGELGHQGDIVRLGGRRLVGQEGDVHAVHGELLLPELEAGIFLVQLGQGPLHLRGSQETSARAAAGG